MTVMQETDDAVQPPMTKHADTFGNKRWYM